MQQPELRFPSFHGLLSVLIPNFFSSLFQPTFLFHSVFSGEKKETRDPPLFSFHTSSNSSKASQNNNFVWKQKRSKLVKKASYFCLSLSSYDLFLIVMFYFFKSLLLLIKKVAVEVLDDPSLIF